MFCIEQLGELWDTQLQEYAAEEHALKVMLQEEAEVRGHQGKISKNSTPLDEWEKLLFGPASDINSKEFQHHTRAHSDLQHFLNTRLETLFQNYYRIELCNKHMFGERSSINYIKTLMLNIGTSRDQKIGLVKSSRGHEL